jgi:glyoxylase-like metal-dependent hydrolase (beta-lactamase superfamily II)
MIIRTLEVGMLRTNCYLVASEEAHEVADGTRPFADGRSPAAVLDPGGDPDAILAAVDELGAVVSMILLTHFHFDHIMAVPEILRETGASLAIHEAEADLLARPPALFRFARPDTPGLTADRLLRDGDEVTVGGSVLQVIHTPGHSPGGVSFYSAEQGAVFCGDVLFAQGVGRTDFPGSSGAQLVRSIRERLFALPDDTVVYPGHGPSTTIGRERRVNPWVGEGRK